MNLIFAALFLMLSGSVLYVMDGTAGSFGQLLLFGSIFVSAFLPLVYKKMDVKLSKPLSISFYFFILLSSISSLINSDLFLLGGTLFLICTYFVLGIEFNSLAPSLYPEVFSKALFWSHAPLIYIPLISGMDFTGYAGVFSNGNSFGSVSVTLLCLIMAKFTHYFINEIQSDRKFRYLKRKMLKYGFLIISLLFLTFASGSRTSAVTALLLIFLCFVFVFLNSVKSKRLFLKTLITAIKGLFILFVLNLFFPLYKTFEHSILGKFILKSDDVLDMRGIVWRKTIEDASILGHGRDYFTENIGFAAHNTFISILGQYGWLPLSMLILGILILIIKSIPYTCDVSNEYRFIPLFIAITFLSLSMAESMMMKSIMVALFAAFGLVSIPKNKEKEYKERNQLKKMTFSSVSNEL